MVPATPSAPASVAGLWGQAVLGGDRLKAKSVTILRSLTYARRSWLIVFASKKQSVEGREPDEHRFQLNGQVDVPVHGRMATC